MIMAHRYQMSTFDIGISRIKVSDQISDTEPVVAGFTFLTYCRAMQRSNHRLLHIKIPTKVRELHPPR